MALTGLEIFSCCPGNAARCGMPTCLALPCNRRKREIGDCPEISEEAKQKLAAAAAMRVAFGGGDTQVQTGQGRALPAR
jgi:acetyl-CoA decarbonylase/synthase complex subunit gamma